MRLFLLLIPFASVTVAGCSTHDAASAPVATHEVVIPGAWVYEPATAQTKVGETVTFRNHGGAAHTVTFDDGFDRTVAPGGATARAFDAPGTYAYHCKLHPPSMKGTIVVVA